MEAIQLDPKGATQLDPKNYYRLPWSLTNNGISWLEVTSKCNLNCEGCYREQSDGHKTLKEIEDELKVFKRERRSDCMSIAGGDPLIHPKIVEIVKMVKDNGWKPILNTNGLALSKSLLRKLKNAGVFGFTFHIDTSQVRKDSPNVKIEKDHNALRQKFAELVAEEGGMICSFNQTVVSQTLSQVPDVVKWAQKHPDIVNSVVFIIFRSPDLIGKFDYFANGEKINVNTTYDNPEWGGDTLLKTEEIVEKIREADPNFEPSAYLNGSVDPLSMKWTIGVRMANKKHSFGYVSPRFMELVQHCHHFFYKKWLSYSHPKFIRTGRSSLWFLSALDPKMRSMLWKYLKTSIKNPLTLFKKAYFQSFTIIQPIDMMPDGRMNMCDSCPDMTVYNGKLYWSCRLEEIKKYGSFVTATPKKS